MKFSRFHTCLGLKLKISSDPVDGFWCIMRFGNVISCERLKWQHKIYGISSPNFAPKLLGHICITFLKGYDADYRKNTELPMNYCFGKNICAELVNSGGAAGEWLITRVGTRDSEGGRISIEVRNRAPKTEISSQK
jgi:hypothetical protein